MFADLLEARAGGRGVAALAVIDGEDERLQMARTPASAAEEPAFLAYSITKSFIAAALLLLQERELIDLDAPLADRFPDIPGGGEMTIRMVMNHTAGIPDYGRLAAYHQAVRNSPSHPWTFDEFLEKSFAHGLAFEPGEDWGYSNPGYMLLKRIAEQTAGEPFADLLARLIFRPLGLSRTFVPESVQDLAGLAPAPSALLSPDRTPHDTRERYHPGWVSHGVIASVPSDIVRFYNALFRGRLLSADSLAQMTDPVPVPIYDSDSSWTRPSYGLGLMIDPEFRYGHSFGHNGQGPGYNSSAFHIRIPGTEGVTFCVMCGIEQGFDTEKMVVEMAGMMEALRREA